MIKRKRTDNPRDLVCYGGPWDGEVREHRQGDDELFPADAAGFYTFTDDRWDWVADKDHD